MIRMVAIRDSCSSPTRNVACMLNKRHEEIKSLFECVCFCGKQGLSFRGHRDDYTATDCDNKGNFMELIQFRAQTDEVLCTHAPRNAVYTSKTVQNEMILSRQHNPEKDH